MNSDIQFNTVYPKHQTVYTDFRYILWIPPHGKEQRITPRTTRSNTLKSPHKRHKHPILNTGGGGGGGTHLKKPLQPSHVMALKWKPVALSPHTPQIRGPLRSDSSGPTADVVTVMGSITAGNGTKKKKRGGGGREGWVARLTPPACFLYASNTYKSKRKAKKFRNAHARTCVNLANGAPQSFKISLRSSARVLCESVCLLGRCVLSSSYTNRCQVISIFSKRHWQPCLDSCSYWLCDSADTHTHTHTINNHDTINGNGGNTFMTRKKGAVGWRLRNDGYV